MCNVQFVIFIIVFYIHMFCCCGLQCGMVDNFNAAKKLISCGADVNSRDKELWTPLHIASAFSRLEIIQLLLEVCHFVSVTMSTILHIVIQCTQFACLVVGEILDGSFESCMTLLTLGE